MDGTKFHKYFLDRNYNRGYNVVAWDVRLTQYFEPTPSKRGLTFVRDAGLQLFGLSRSAVDGSNEQQRPHLAYAGCQNTGRGISGLIVKLGGWSYGCPPLY